MNQKYNRKSKNPSHTVMRNADLAIRSKLEKRGSGIRSKPDEVTVTRMIKPYPNL